MKIFLKYLFFIFLILLIKSEESETQIIENQIEKESEGVKLINNPDNEELSPNDKVEIKQIWVDEQKRYKKISEDFRLMEFHFKNCIDKMQDIDYTQNGIRNCVGIDLQKAINDTNYEKKKQISLTETKLKKIMFFECYEPAGLNEDWAQGCDVLEKDLLDFLWAELNFYQIIEFNQKKYLFELAKIPVDAFENVLKEIHLLYKSMFDILNEIDVHQDLMVIQLRSYIDKRTVKIKKKIIEIKQHPKPIIRKKKIRISQIGREPAKRLKPEDIPRRIILDGNSNHMFTSNISPRVDELIDHERYSTKRKETEYIVPNGPKVIFRNKKRVMRRYLE